MGSTIPGDTRTVAKLPDEGSPIGTMTPSINGIIMGWYGVCYDLLGRGISERRRGDSGDSGLEISMTMVADDTNDRRMKLVRSKDDLFRWTTRGKFNRVKTVREENSRESSEAMGRVDDDGVFIDTRRGRDHMNGILGDILRHLDFLEEDSKGTGKLGMRNKGHCTRQTRKRSAIGQVETHLNSYYHGR